MPPFKFFQKKKNPITGCPRQQWHTVCLPDMEYYPSIDMNKLLLLLTYDADLATCLIYYNYFKAM